MRFTALTIGALASSLVLAACDKAATNEPESKAARDAAGDNTLAQALGDNDSRFAGAVKAAGLDATLAGPGPYTVLVPANAAFDKLPAGAVDNLMKPENKAALTALLSNHILSGAVLTEDIGKAIDAGNGKTQLMTIGGETLTAAKEGNAITLTDSKGAKATISGADTKVSNGVVQRIDSVLAAG